MSSSTPWVWVECVCIGCAEGMFGRHIRAGTSHVRGDLGKMTREAKRHGWTIDNKGDWLCVSCESTRIMTASELRDVN